MGSCSCSTGQYGSNCCCSTKDAPANPIDSLLDDTDMKERLNDEGPRKFYDCEDNGSSLASGREFNEIVPLEITTCKHPVPASDNALPYAASDLPTMQKSFSTTTEGLSSFHASAASGDISNIRLLISSSQDINAVDSSLCTPLHTAIMKDHEDIACLLVQAKANLNDADSFGHSPLHLAAIHGHVEVASLLIRVSVDVNRCDTKSGRSPLHSAASNSKAGVDMISLLLEKRAEVNAADGRQMVTPLHEATSSGFIERVALLLKSRASLDVVDKSGRNPLHRAASSGKEDIALFLLHYQASPDVTDLKFGYTPLHLAAIAGHCSVVSVLLKNGARREVTTKTGRTALQFAKNRSDPDIISLLLKPKRCGCFPW